MDDDEYSIDAEYQGNHIDVVSKDPLLGRLELMGDGDQLIHVMLNRAMAEDLLSALVQFLGHGEGADAQTYHIVQ